jgi:hypothetical protein
MSFYFIKLENRKAKQLLSGDLILVGRGRIERKDIGR